MNEESQNFANKVFITNQNRENECRTHQLRRCKEKKLSVSEILSTEPNRKRKCEEINSTYTIQKEQERMMEMANSIQSFPSTSAYSISLSGKYSGMGIGSVNREMK